MTARPEREATARKGARPPGRTAAGDALRRELLAVLVLYAAISVLPLLIGLAFGP